LGIESGPDTQYSILKTYTVYAMDIKQAIEKAVRFSDLSENETREVFGMIMSGEASGAQIGAFVTALRMKGETVEEITGAAMAMRERSLRIKTGPEALDIDRDDINVDDETILDTCGTGGTGTNTFNISTTVAFVVAAAGVKVAKHGNRSASSLCGSADVLEALGVKLDVPVEVTERCIRAIGIGFMYAPFFHGAMKHAVAPRKEIGIRTIFNLLGPLCNPASATCQVLGVYDAKLTLTIARVLKNLGSKRAFVVHGMDTLDEVTITGKTKVSELKNGRIKTYFVSPSDFGIKKAARESIRGGDAKDNAVTVKGVLSGEKGPKRDIVLMNAAVALVAAGKARDLKEGMRIAADAIDSGKALEKLKGLVGLTNT
jgi:anthranilate phosphoribosyltransferase